MRSGKFQIGCRAVTGDVKRLGGGYWRLEMRLGLVWGYRDAFGVESVPECWGGGRGDPRPLQAIPWGGGGGAECPRTPGLEGGGPGSGAIFGRGRLAQPRAESGPLEGPLLGVWRT